MQIQSLRIKSYRSGSIADTVSPDEAIARLKKLELYEQLKSEGCSRATCYRWHKRYQQPGWTGLA